MCPGFELYTTGKRAAPLRRSAHAVHPLLCVPCAYWGVLQGAVAGKPLRVCGLFIVGGDPDDHGRDEEAARWSGLGVGGGHGQRRHVERERESGRSNRRSTFSSSKLISPPVATHDCATPMLLLASRLSL